jgi:o-succinylbenzoate---CoA ligase
MSFESHPESLPTALVWQATHNPHRVALRGPGYSLTWSELSQLVAQMSSSFFNQREGNRHRVALWSEDPLGSLLVLLTSWYARRSVVIANPRLPESIIFKQLKSAEVQTLFCDKAFQVQLPYIRVREMPRLFRAPLHHPLEATVQPEENEACLLFTSGSTGDPKGVSLSYKALFKSALQSNEVTKLNESSCWNVGLPLCHIAGLMTVVRCMVAGSTIFLTKSTGQKGFIEALQSSSLTHTSVVPAMLAEVLNNHPDLIPLLQKLTALLLGGERPALSLLRVARKHEISVYLSYGMTETCSHVTLAPPDTSLGSAGRVLAHSRVRINKENNRIEIAGDILFRGYLSGEGSFIPQDEEWFQTQDCGSFDESGDLYVYGRVDDVIISGGEKIDPRVIEDIAAGHPTIAEVAVTKIPHSKWGERPVLWLVQREGLASSSSLRDEFVLFLKKNLSKLYYPDKIIFRHSLPRTSLGKIDRQKLLLPEETSCVDPIQEE